MKKIMIKNKKKTTIEFLKEFADKGYENAVECLKKQKVEVVGVNLDIKGRFDGCDIIRYIIKEQLEIPYIYIHYDICYHKIYENYWNFDLILYHNLDNNISYLFLY